MIEKMQESQVLVFDFDGTICDSLQSAVDAINHFSNEFGFKKVESHDLPQLQEMNAKQIMEFLGVSMTQLPILAYKTKKHIRSQMELLTPFEGIVEVLQSLKAQNRRLGILTSNSEENVRIFLKRYNLDYFDFIYADSSVFGKSVVLRRLLKELGLKSENVIYIGDETRDIEAAKSLHLKVVSVSWGYNTRNALLSHQPDFLIDHPSELPKIFV